jgi:urease accessory protein
LHIQCQVADGAHALVTTPGATKFYRSAGATAEQQQSLQIAAGARLEWLPQENIFFPGAITRLQTNIELSKGARFIGWEIHCLGLPVNAEPFDSGQAEFRFNIERDNRPLLLERLTVTADKLHAKAGLRGMPVNATLLATRVGATELDQVRELLAETPGAGVTLIDDLLVVRYLGDSTARCRNLFIKIWATIRETVLGRPPCPPRIWST